MFRTYLLGILALLVALPPVVHAGDPVATILAKAKSTCEAITGAEFDPGDAITRIDLTGDGGRETVIFEGGFRCSPGVSPYCGSGGCSLHAVVGEKSWTFQAEDWRVIDWTGQPILLIARDGGWCGGAGAQRCFEAVTWSAGQMLTVMPQQAR